MKVLTFKRFAILVLVAVMIPFTSISHADTKSTTYDKQQLIRDVAILYRQHKLAETAVKPKAAKKVSAKKANKNIVKAATKKRSLKNNSETFGFRKNPSGKYKKQMLVTATAYTSHVNQTDSTPNIAAWGDRLEPGMKAIAVSRDMLNKYGLKHRSKVRIKGLQGEYLVLDKMNKRWEKKIDIYMGMDLKKAYKWGRRKVELQWN